MMNVLIVGLGSIAKKHIKALNSLAGNFNIYALRSGKNVEEQDGVTNIYELSEIQENLDFAIISNPTNLHYQFIDKLAALRVPLFIEKPPLSTLKESVMLADKIDHLGLMTYVACNLRFHPCIQYIKEYLGLNSSKRINEVNIYCGSYLPDWRPDQDFRKNYSANAAMGGGVHLDLFHELDYTHWFFGTPVSAHCFKRSASVLNIDAVDYANYVLNYPDFTVGITLNYYRRDPKRTIEILFEEGTWTIDLIKNRITSNNSIIYQADDFMISETYKAQIQYFIKCLTDNQMPMNTFRDSLETLKTCLCDE